MLIQMAEVLSQPLMLESSFVARLVSLARSGKPIEVTARVNDVRLAAEKQATAARSSSSKITAVIPICGFIDQRSSFMMEVFGGTSLESLLEGVNICLNEPRIGGIIFDCATPGGSAFGVKEAADYIASVRGNIPMVAVSNSMMASAGYYLGAATDRIYATPSSVTGSIGVAWEHAEHSKADAAAGVTSTIFRIPEYKMEGHPAEPLTDAAKANMQARCEDLYQMFTGDVARYRGTTASNVKEKYGQGRMLSAEAAVGCGMADRVATFADVCSQMQSGAIGRSLAQTRMEAPADVAMMRNRMNAALL